MALATNYPIALAPGMGLNAFFAFTLCGAKGIPWQAALGLVFYSGLIFLALSVTGLRKKLVEAIPIELKLAITGGIGFFIAFIGLKNGGVVVANPATFVGLGRSVEAGTAASDCRDYRHGNSGNTQNPRRNHYGDFGAHHRWTDRSCARWERNDHRDAKRDRQSAGVFSAYLPEVGSDAISGRISWARCRSCSPFCLSISSTIWERSLEFPSARDCSTRTGTCQRLGERSWPTAGAAMFGSSLGTSTVTSYIESAAGVEAGGRTGLTVIVTALCFILALFFTPLILIIPAVATAPALVIVGAFMMQGLAELDLKDFEKAAPAFVTILAMPLAFSISEGIAFGLLTYVGLKVGTGKSKEVGLVTYVLAVLFILHFLFGR